MGPIARAAGVAYDVRKVFPYLGYETFEFQVPTQTAGDVYSRYLVRVAEMRESVKICRQALDRIAPAGEWAVADPRITPPPEGSGLHGDGGADSALPDLLAGLHGAGRARRTCRSKVRAESTGSRSSRTAANRPWRVKSRAPSLLACQALERMIVGGLIADVIAVIGSIDVVMGDVDR